VAGSRAVCEKKPSEITVTVTVTVTVRAVVTQSSQRLHSRHTYQMHNMWDRPCVVRQGVTEFATFFAYDEECQ
jgi:hypothetical protein